MASVRTVAEHGISESEDCRELTAAKIPFAAGGSGFLAIAGATFFSGTGFLGGTVTTERRIYALEAAKINERKMAQPAHTVRASGPEDKRVKTDRHSSGLAKYLLEVEQAPAPLQPPLEVLLGQSPLRAPHTL